MQYFALLVFAVLCFIGLVRPLWALVLLLVMFALEVSLQAALDVFRAQPALANIIVAGVVACALLVAMVRQQRPMVGQATLSLGIVTLIYAWSILSIAWSPAETVGPNQGVNIILEAYPYVVISIFLAPILVGSVEEWRKATTLMLIGGSLVALSILVSPEFSIRSGRIGTSLDGVMRTSPLAIAQMGGMLAIFGALSAGGRKTGFQTAIRIGAFLCGALLALFSGTRGQAVFALLSIALFLPMSRQLKSLGSYFSIVAVGAVVMIGAYVTFNFVLGQADTDRWQTGAISSATAIRQSSAMSLLAEFLASPMGWILGLGFNAFSDLGDFGDLGYVHNLYVEVLCELGLPMFVLLIVLFVRTGRSSLTLFRRYRDQPAERSALAVLFAMVVFQALIATKEGNLWSSWNLFMFMLIITRLEVRSSVLEHGEVYAQDELDEAADDLEEDERSDHRGALGVGQPA